MFYGIPYILIYTLTQNIHIPENGGMLTALYKFHSHDISRFVLGLTSLFVVVNCLGSFQMYGMPICSQYSVMWCLNWFSGTYGIGLSGILIAASILTVA